MQTGISLSTTCYTSALANQTYIVVLEGPDLQSHHEVKRLLDAALPLEWKVKSIGTVGTDVSRTTYFNEKGEAL